MVSLVRLLEELFDARAVELMHRQLGMHGLVDIESHYNEDVTNLIRLDDVARRELLKHLADEHGPHQVAEAVILLAILAQRRVCRVHHMWNGFESLRQGKLDTLAACADAYQFTLELGAVFDYHFPYDAFAEAGSSVFQDSEYSS